MWQIIRDYFAAFHIDRIKAGYRRGDSFTEGYLIAGLIALPASLGVFTKSPDVILRFYVTAVVVLFAQYAASLHPVTMPKLFYLCPMSEAERRAYIRKAYGFKIGFAVAISALGMGALGMFGKINGSFGLLVVAETGAIAVCNGIVERDRMSVCAGEKKSSFNGSRDGWEIMARIVSLCCAFFTMLCTVWSEDSWDMLGVVVSVCMACLELPLTILMIKRVRPALERALNYEGIAAEQGERPLEQAGVASAKTIRK